MSKCHNHCYWDFLIVHTHATDTAQQNVLIYTFYNLRLLYRTDRHGQNVLTSNTTISSLKSQILCIVCWCHEFWQSAREWPAPQPMTLTFCPWRMLTLVGCRTSTSSPLPHIPCSFHPQEYSSSLSVKYVKQINIIYIVCPGI